MSAPRGRQETAEQYRARLQRENKGRAATRARRQAKNEAPEAVERRRAMRLGKAVPAEAERVIEQHEDAAPDVTDAPRTAKGKKNR